MAVGPGPKVSTRVAKPQSPEDASTAIPRVVAAAQRAAREGVVIEAAVPRGETQFSVQGRPLRVAERKELKGEEEGESRRRFVDVERVAEKEEGGVRGRICAAVASAEEELLRGES